MKKSKTSIKISSEKEISVLNDLEQYYIENKIKNLLINNKFINWDIENIHFLLSIFENNKYKLYNNISTLLLLDYINWLKKDNNSIYAKLEKKYLISDLEYIYNKISTDTKDNLNIENNINYVNILEEYIKNDKEIPNNYITNPGYDYICSYDYNNLSNNNYVYYFELAMLFFFILFLFLIKYFFSFKSYSSYSCYDIPKISSTYVPIKNNYENLDSFNSSKFFEYVNSPDLSEFSSAAYRQSSEPTKLAPEKIFKEKSGLNLEIIFSKLFDYIDKKNENVENVENVENAENIENAEKSKKDENINIPFLSKFLNNPFIELLSKNISF
jgi:hypothetical protein